jgi:hypothetical protein
MLKRKLRKEFTSKQKAQIYKRDRATCVFSGKSLWSLDYGACPLAEWDWADHIKPAARDGKSEIENGICTSYTFNVKKRANGADKFHLLDPDLEGAPSQDFYYYFGGISLELKDQLIRLSHIETADWYFNRAVSLLMMACEKAYYKPGHKRKPGYYRNSALNKFKEFRSHGGSRESLEKRSLILHPECEDIQLLLSMIAEQKLSEFDQKLRRLKVIYTENAKAMDAFWKEDTIPGMRKQVAKISRNKAITPAVSRAVTTHLDFWENDPRCK